MKRFKICLPDGTLVSSCSKVTDSEGQEWVNLYLSQNAWAKPERWVRLSEDGTIHDEDISKALDERIIQEVSGDFVEKKFAAEYEIVEEDMTAELEQKAAKEAEKAADALSLKELKKSDLNNVNDLAEAVLKLIKHFGG